ncbi:MAG: hypothetical protein JKY20_08475 [Alphaproteobacteria bacterium]|nr:hypothetical protein [Alphaproteobacteria bacterium]
MKRLFNVAAILSMIFFVAEIDAAKAHGESHEDHSVTPSKLQKMPRPDHGQGSGEHGAKNMRHETMGRDEIPKDLNTSTSKLSGKKRFKVKIAPQENQPAINVLQSWILNIATADGRPVENAMIIVFGGMPTHGHGLPTAPRVTRTLETANISLKALDLICRAGGS